MTATRTGTNVDRSLEMAGRFLDRIERLPAAERGRIATESFGSSAHTGAMLAVADEVTTLRNKDREGHVSAFLVDAERRIDGMNLDARVGGLVKAAVRALVVHDFPGLEMATRQLYAPFEPVVPFASLAP